jgi:hypothetical protein
VEYEWDPDKDVENRRKHGLALADGITALEDPDAVERLDDRFPYGEYRFVTYGMNGRRVLVVVWTERAEDVIRIISVRKAEKNEEKFYFQGEA